MLSYGIDWPVAVLRTAQIVVCVLDRTRPAGIPVERVTQFALPVNSKTARSLRITVPYSIMAQATEGSE